MKSCLWLLALLPLHAPPAEACSSEPVSAIALDAALPRSGSSAPTNTWIWLPPSAADGAALDPGAIEVTQDGVAVEIDVVELAFADEAGRAMLVARPTAPLTPGLTVTVTVAGEVATAFEVAGTADEPPAPPRVVSVDVTAASSVRCRAPSHRRSRCRSTPQATWCC